MGEADADAGRDWLTTDMGRNLELLKRAHEAFNRGDIPAAQELLHPDVEWGTAGAFPGVERVYRGHKGFALWVQEVREPWSSFDVWLELIWEDESSLAVEERLRGRGAGSGAETVWQVWSLYDIVEGRLVRRRSWDNEAALRAALTPEAGGAASGPTN